MVHLENHVMMNEKASQTPVVNESKYFQSFYKPISKPWTCRDCCVDFTNFKLWMQHRQTCHLVSQHERITLSWMNPDRNQSQTNDSPRLINNNNNQNVTSSPSNRTVGGNLSYPRSPSSSSSSSSSENEEAQDEEEEEELSEKEKDPSTVITTTFVNGKKVNSCTLCHKTFDRLACAKSHVVEHTALNPFPCSMCDQGYRYKSTLTRHMQICHKSKTIFCDLCDKSFWTHQQRYRHHKENHPNFVFKTNREVSNNLNAPTSSGQGQILPAKCPLCPKRFSHLFGLKMHTVKTHKNVKTGQHPVLQKSKSPPPPHSPTVLGRSTTDPNVILRDSVYFCSFCGESFKSLYQASKHTWTHTKVIPYSCDICQATFTAKSSLIYHVKHLHPQEMIKKLEKKKKKKKTSKTTTRTISTNKVGQQQTEKVKTRKSGPYSAYYTREIVKGEVRISCKHCPKTFTRSMEALIHARLHSDLRPYKCKDCSMSYFSNQGFHKHRQKYHSKPKHIK